MFKFAKVRNVKSPNRGTSLSAGVDFYVPNDFKPMILDPLERVLIKSGIIVEFDKDVALIGFNKSGISLNHGLQVGASVIDVDYVGEMGLHIVNTSNAPVAITPGKKLLQFILVRVSLDTPLEVERSAIHMAATERGEGGFGSTGLD